jgi:guanidinobutyrase / D-arginase
MGFTISHADEIEEIGYKGIVKKIRDTVGTNPVYRKSFDAGNLWTNTCLSVSFDIDVIDPSQAPALVPIPNVRTLALSFNR